MRLDVVKRPPPKADEKTKTAEEPLFCRRQHTDARAENGGHKSDSLLTLADRQLKLAGEERWDELVPVMEEWQRRTSALTRTAPPSAARALARAAEVVGLVRSRLRAERTDAAR